MRYAELGLALFAGCVIGWLWGERPELLREFSWLSAMTAFGTVGAAVGAVSIAWWQHRIRQNERRVAATHPAAKIYLPLAVMSGEVNQLDLRLAEAIQVVPSTATLLSYIDEAKNIRAKYTFPDPVVLTPIGRDCGVKLASALAQFDIAINFLERSKQHFSPHADVDVREQELSFIRGILGPVIMLLTHVSRECQKIALPLDSPYH